MLWVQRLKAPQGGLESQVFQFDFEKLTSAVGWKAGWLTTDAQ